MLIKKYSFSIFVFLLFSCQTEVYFLKSPIEKSKIKINDDYLTEKSKTLGSRTLARLSDCKYYNYVITKDTLKYFCKNDILFEDTTYLILGDTICRDTLFITRTYYYLKLNGISRLFPFCTVKKISNW
jgi:hypothetical protein